MTEKTWWATKIKPAWHNIPAGRQALKIQDAYNSGFPDVDVIFNGVAAKIELKYLKDRPRNDDKPMTFSLDKKNNRRCMCTPNQLVYLLNYEACGGLAFLMIGLGNEWFMLAAEDVVNEGMSYNQLRVAATYTGTNKTLGDVPRWLEEDEGDDYYDEDPNDDTP